MVVANADTRCDGACSAWESRVIGGSYAVLGWGGTGVGIRRTPRSGGSSRRLLHSVMVEEKRRLLRSWNLSLVIATFALTILGTFLTRSGVVNSVHAFSLSAIGPLLLGYLVAIIVLSVGLLLWRLPMLRDSGSVGAPLSREAIFLFQNVVFVAATLTVLLGTLYPLIAEAFTGAQLSIGRPYFDRVEVPLALALLFLMGIGPQSRGMARRAHSRKQFTAPSSRRRRSVARRRDGTRRRVRGAHLRARRVRRRDRGAGVRARHSRARKLNARKAGTAFANLLRRNGRRYGGYIVTLASCSSRSRSRRARRRPSRSSRP